MVCVPCWRKSSMHAECRQATVTASPAPGAGTDSNVAHAVRLVVRCPGSLSQCELGPDEEQILKHQRLGWKGPSAPSVELALPARDTREGRGNCVMLYKDGRQGQSVPPHRATLLPSSPAPDPHASSMLAGLCLLVFCFCFCFIFAAVASLPRTTPGV